MLHWHILLKLTTITISHHIINITHSTCGSFKKKKCRDFEEGISHSFGLTIGADQLPCPLTLNLYLSRTVLLGWFELGEVSM